jgi:membrane fusion protein (multidrug efflux system)
MTETPAYPGEEGSPASAGMKGLPGKGNLPAVSRTRLLIFGLLLAAGLVWGGLRVFHSFHYVETDNAQIEGDVYPIISRVPGKVQAVRVKDNQNVHRGDTLIILEPADYEIRRDMAEAALQTARASVTSAGAEISAADANRRKLNADLRRNRNLRQQDVISQAEYDAVSAGAEAASAHYTAAAGQHRAAEAQLRAREAELRNAELQLSWTTITATEGGHVSKKNVQPGQYVAPGQQLIALVASSDLWVVANFKETQLENMKPGQPALIRVDAFPGKEFRGRVESISSGTGAKFALLPPDNASGNYVKVTQRVPVKIVFTEKPDKPLAAGMNVIAEIKVR